MSAKLIEGTAGIVPGLKVNVDRSVPVGDPPLSA